MQTPSNLVNLNIIAKQLSVPCWPAPPKSSYKVHKHTSMLPTQYYLKNPMYTTQLSIPACLVQSKVPLTAKRFSQESFQEITTAHACAQLRDGLHQWAKKLQEKLRKQQKLITRDLRLTTACDWLEHQPITPHRHKTTGPRP